MSNKLSGREAVKALMDGKSVKRKDRVLQYFEDEDAFVYFGSPFTVETFERIVVHDDWEIVQEPLVWEGEMLFDTLADLGINAFPIGFYGKTIKVRIEEIGE